MPHTGNHYANELKRMYSDVQLRIELLYAQLPKNKKGAVMFGKHKVCYSDGAEYTIKGLCRDKHGELQMIQAEEGGPQNDKQPFGYSVIDVQVDVLLVLEKLPINRIVKQPTNQHNGNQ